MQRLLWKVQDPCCYDPSISIWRCQWNWHICQTRIYNNISIRNGQWKVNESIWSLNLRFMFYRMDLKRAIRLPKYIQHFMQIRIVILVTISNCCSCSKLIWKRLSTFSKKKIKDYKENLIPLWHLKSRVTTKVIDYILKESLDPRRSETGLLWFPSTSQRSPKVQRECSSI